jgi:hypothetical protein
MTRENGLVVVLYHWKQRDVAVRQRLAIVLHAEAVITMLPLHLARLAVDQPNHVEAAEA